MLFFLVYNLPSRLKFLQVSELATCPLPSADTKGETLGASGCLR